MDALMMIKGVGIVTLHPVNGDVWAAEQRASFELRQKIYEVLKRSSDESLGFTRRDR